jgi:hypothetical protein
MIREKRSRLLLHRRRFEQFGDRKSMDNPLPLDFGPLEIDEKTDGEAGGSQIVETLRRVFAGEALRTFQFDHEHVFYEDIRKVLADTVALVGDCK